MRYFTGSLRVVSRKCIFYLQCLRSMNQSKKISHRPVAIDLFGLFFIFRQILKTTINETWVKQYRFYNFTQFHAMHSRISMHSIFKYLFLPWKWSHSTMFLIVQDFQRRIYHTYKTYFNLLKSEKNTTTK